MQFILPDGWKPNPQYARLALLLAAAHRANQFGTRLATEERREGLPQVAGAIWYAFAELIDGEMVKAMDRNARAMAEPLKSVGPVQ